MPQNHCCAVDCNSSTLKQNNLVKYPWMKEITFHSFPLNHNSSMDAIKGRFNWMSAAAAAVRRRHGLIDRSMLSMNVEGIHFSVYQTLQAIVCKRILSAIALYTWLQTK